jgi:hypothetical protein
MKKNYLPVHLKRTLSPLDLSKERQHSLSYCDRNMTGRKGSAYLITPRKDTYFSKDI